MIPFIGIEIIKNGTKIETHVYRKATNTGLPLHFKSHTDKRYKVGLLKTMLHRTYVLSPETEAFYPEYDKLRSIFNGLNYSRSLSQWFPYFLFETLPDKNTIRISLPFKDQVSANAVRRHLSHLSYKIGPTVQPVFVSRKLEQDFRPKEVKPCVVN